MTVAGIVSAALPSATIGLRAGKADADADIPFGDSFASLMESGGQDGSKAEDPPDRTDMPEVAIAEAEAGSGDIATLPAGQMVQPDPMPEVFPSFAMDRSTAEPDLAEVTDTPPQTQPAAAMRQAVMPSLWYTLADMTGPAPVGPGAGSVPDRVGEIGGGTWALPAVGRNVPQLFDIANSLPDPTVAQAIPPVVQAAGPSGMLPDDRAAASQAGLASLPDFRSSSPTIPSVIRAALTAGSSATVNASVIASPLSVAASPRSDDRGNRPSTEAGKVSVSGKNVWPLSPPLPVSQPDIAIPARAEIVPESARLADPTAGSQVRAVSTETRIQPPIAVPDATAIRRLPTASDATATGDAHAPTTVDATVGSLHAESSRDSTRSATVVAQSATAWPGSGDIARQLALALAPTRAGGTEIILSPAELGKVRLTLLANDGGITLQITAERPETADLMRRHIDTLVQEFRSLGYQSVSLDFGQSHDRGHQANSHGGADHGPTVAASGRNDGTRQDIHSAVDAAPELPGSGRGTTQLDLRM